MKQTCKKLVLLIAAVATSGLVYANAADKKAKLELEAQIESRVLKILKGYDELALAFATVKYDTTQRSLPATPFVIQDNKLTKDFNYTLQAINITVYSKLNPMPQEVSAMVQDAVADLGVRPSLNYKALPQDFGNNLQPVDPETGEANVNQTFNLKADDIRTTLEAHNQKMDNMIYALGGIFAALGLFVVFGFVTNSRNRKILQAGLSKISSSVEESGGGGGQVIDMPQMDQARDQGRPQALSSGDKDNIATYSDDALVAMLTDCYWGHYDTFGSFIWRRIPVSRRAEILTKVELLEEYVHFLSGMDEQNLGFDQDPYYLNPLPIGHLDNDALTEAVRNDPGLFVKLPVMRVDSLSLGVKERLKLMSSIGKFEEFTMPDFQTQSDSQHRVLKKHKKFILNSIKEESEILAMEGLDPFVCRDIPTLGFLAKLDEEKIFPILEGLSAQELAMAWIGPEDVLEKLMSVLPEKKGKLVEAYLEKIKPSRNSRPFQVLNFRANQICFPENELLGAAEEDTIDEAS